MSRPRGGTPLTGGMPSLEAANQAQIEDLVQRNMTLNHTIQRLNEQVELERKKCTTAVNDMRDKWLANQKEWKEGCEDLLSSYRIVQKTLEYELAKERSGIYQEMAATREEKLLRLQREYKITLFQMKEEELENKLEDMEEDYQSRIEVLQATLDETKKRCADYMSKYKDGQESWSRAHKEKEDKEASVTKMRGELANLTAASETLKSKLERTKLQLDGSQTRIADLERTNDELQRTNKDLTRQLEQWKSLETREGEAAEEQRKHRLALEVELRQLKEESQKKEEENERIIAKSNRKIEKLSNAVSQLEVGAFAKIVQEIINSLVLKETVAEAEKEANASRKDVLKLQKQLERLKSDLEEERARVRPPSPQKLRKDRKETSSPVDEDDNSVEEVAATRTKTEKRNKPASSSKDEEVTTTKPKARKQPVIARKTTGSKPPPKRAVPSSPKEDRGDDSEIEEIPDPGPLKKTTKDKGHVEEKGKGKGKKKAQEDEDDSAGEESEPAPKRKGKRKGRSSDEELEESTTSKPVAGPSKSRNKQGDTSTKPVKASSRAASRQPQGRGASVLEQDVEGKKKKRKINIFPTASSMGGPGAALTFGNLNVGDGNLNIPTVLSPVKDDDLVPARATSSNMLSSILKFTRR
ncbi:hypothetical protein CVT24_000366 [Panaeolus cyanescens]|uniref:Uncharacterized protein n=1 Tax=Panaeolus cyanescens TaxID=181874 RepID=A0A409YD00_9AGAR|nr:hypothetical protein CVT24_000366 [Panaeolus cyanescens]